MEIILPKSFDTFGKVVVGIAAAFVTYTVNEIRQDVKNLMIVSTQNTTKIESIENRINNLEKVTMFDKLNNSKSTNNNKSDQKPKKLFFIKKEDEDDEKKWIASL
jgi:hypothetical protein